MEILVYYDIWALPFAFCKGKDYDPFHWAFSVGPIHFVSMKP